MKATIVASVIGVLGFNEDGKVAASRLFPKDVSKIASKLVDIETGKVTDDISAVVQELKQKGCTTYIFENSGLGQSVKIRLGVDIEVAAPSEMGENLRKKMGEYAVMLGFIGDASELAMWVHNVSMEVSQLKVRKATMIMEL